MTDMKFGDIKQGDTVYLKSGISVVWGGIQKYFWLPKKVTRITPKQFVVNNKRYKKENGYNIRGKYYERVYMLGDVVNNSPVIDQTKEKNTLIYNIDTAYAIKTLISQFKIKHNHPNLVDIHTKIKEIESLLNEGNK